MDKVLSRKEIKRRKKISVHNSKFWLGKKRPPFSKEWIGKITKNLNPYATKGMKFPNRKRTQRHSEATKRKIGLNGFHYGMLGKHLSKEAKRKIGEAERGEKHYLWDGGCLRFWIIQAKIRDNYTCQICGLQDKDIIEVDHIIPKTINPDLKKDINNMVALCPNCHRRKTLREKQQKLY